MSDNTLASRLENLPPDADLTDANTYMRLLYPDGADEAAQQEAPQQDEAQQEQAQAAPAGTSAPSGAGTETEQEAADVAGVATKDGKRVIPYNVLADTRAARQQAEQRARELAEANAQLQAKLQEALGNAKPKTELAELDLTDEEIEAAAEDFPLLGKLAKAIKAGAGQQHTAAELAALRAELAQLRGQAPAATAAAAQNSPQELIDQRPLLSQWQAKGGAAWQMAVALDDELKASPDWAGKSMADRFAEVERRIADEFGIQLPPSTATPTTPAAQTSAANQPRTKPAALPTLTDMAAMPVKIGDPMDTRTAAQMVDAAMDMTEEQLRKLAGLSY